MKKRGKIITIAIDSPAAAGAGTQAKLIAKEYKLLYLDTGKIYRLVGKLKINNKKKFDYNFLKRKINKLNLKDLNSKKLLSDNIAVEASVVAKVSSTRQQCCKTVGETPPKRQQLRRTWTTRTWDLKTSTS